MSDNKFATLLGMLIQNARTAKGISQAKLAELTQLHRNSINNFENGKRIPDAYVLSQIAAALEQPISYFFPASEQGDLDAEGLSTEERILLIHFRRVRKYENRLMAIAQIKSIADLEAQLSKEAEAEK